MFHKADLVLITKVDLVPHLPGFRLEALEDALARTMPEPRVIQVSAVTGEGVESWIDWLAERRAALPAPVSRTGDDHHDHDHHHDHEHTAQHSHPHAPVAPGGRG
jgi:hydrogenase nickel incorporation protein HypB